MSFTSSSNEYDISLTYKLFIRRGEFFCMILLPIKFYLDQHFQPPCCTAFVYTEWSYRKMERVFFSSSLAYEIRLRISLKCAYATLRLNGQYVSQKGRNPVEVWFLGFDNNTVCTPAASTQSPATDIRHLFDFPFNNNREGFSTIYIRSITPTQMLF